MSYPKYSEHSHSQPEVYHDPADQAAIPHHPTAYQYSGAPQQRYQPIHQPSHVVNENENRRTICGLRLVTFWLSLALVVVILVGAIAGGVGGALANDDDSSSSNTSGQSSTSTTNLPAASSNVPDTGFAQLYCKNHSIYETSTGARFKQYCAIDWSGGSDAAGGGIVHDISIMKAGTFQSCMNQCALHNKKSPESTKCKAIGYDPDLTQAVADAGGNCWLKDDRATGNTLVDDPFPEMHAVAELL